MSKTSRRTLTLTETWTITWEAGKSAQPPSSVSTEPLSRTPTIFAHWAAFPKDQPICEVLPVAEAALVHYGPQIDSQAFSDNYIVAGGNTDVLVLVTCIPEGEQSWVVVYAAASTATLAAQACATVSELIGKRR